MVYHTGMNKTQTNTTALRSDATEYILPTELASLFINLDWSIVDYIDDDLYEESIMAFLKELELDGVEIIDIVEDSNQFVKYHDLSDYGVLACDCSTYIAR